MIDTKNRKWIRLFAPCEAAAFEAVANYLFEQGADGVEEQDAAIVGYFNGKHDVSELKKSVLIFLIDLQELGFSTGEPQVTEQPVEDWSAGWRNYVHAIPVTENIVIKPPWEAWEGLQSIVIDIMPRMAFGTGSHETTQLCLELLEKYIQPDDSVLDVGTGSGILAIAAAKLGAQCVAVEIDPDALENTHENVIANHVDGQINIYPGSLEVVPKRTYDLILANINRKVLVEMLADMIPLCHSTTRLILSGILIVEQNLIFDKIGEIGLSVVESRELGEWVGLVVGRKFDFLK